MFRPHASESQSRNLNLHNAARGIETKSTDQKPAVELRDEKAGSISASLPSFDNDEPTEEERATLRHVSDKLPLSAFLVAIIELCERFTYYGLSGPFQNYIQRGYKDPSGLPGALGRLIPNSS